MYTEYDDDTDDWTWQAAEADVYALFVETTALGDAVENAFKGAASAFFGDAHQAMRVAVEAQPAETPVLAKIVAVLSQRALASDQYRRIGELQQIAGAFAQVGKYAREIAGVALELHGATESLVARSAPEVYDRLGTLIQQTYIVLRGSVQALRTWDATTARHVLDAAAEVDRLLLDVRNAAQRAIAMQSNGTVPFQRVVIAGSRMREIVAQAQTVARLIAATPVALTAAEAHSGEAYT